MATVNKRHRGFNIEITEAENGYFDWKVKREDGTIVAEPDHQYTFQGDDVEDAFDNAKSALDDFLDG